MDFSDIKQGDTIRVTTAAHKTKGGFGTKPREVPEQTLTVRVTLISAIPGQPGRQQAYCTMLTTADGEVLEEPALLFPAQAAHPVLGKQRASEYRPTLLVVNDTAGQTFERA